MRLLGTLLPYRTLFRYYNTDGYADKWIYVVCLDNKGYLRLTLSDLFDTYANIATIIEAE